MLRYRDLQRLPSTLCFRLRPLHRRRGGLPVTARQGQPDEGRRQAANARHSLGDARFEAFCQDGRRLGEAPVLLGGQRPCQPHENRIRRGNVDTQVLVLIDGA